jgi:hypothetical protein
MDEWSAHRKAATYTGKYKHRINGNIHALSGIRIHDLSVQAGEDISCLRPRGHCDRLLTSSDRNFYPILCRNISIVFSNIFKDKIFFLNLCSCFRVAISGGSQVYADSRSVEKHFLRYRYENPKGYQ